ncbi:imm11 family protein [Pseudomonas sp. RA_5y_Pfl1_P24]|uniref:imm11 family protein n=1 Tax=unclassified Pseudomonas TaxID=196821 RepID=UPI00403F65F9
MENTCEVLIGGQHIFRVKKYSGEIVVSEEVKCRLETVGAVGMLFESVSGDDIGGSA